jgi:hypothetical protein
MIAFQAAKPREIDQQSNRTGDIGTGARASLLPGEHHHHRARGLPLSRRWTRIGKIDNRIRTTVNKDNVKIPTSTTDTFPRCGCGNPIRQSENNIRITNAATPPPPYQQKKRRDVFGEHRRSESDGGDVRPGGDRHRNITQACCKRGVSIIHKAKATLNGFGG